MFKFLRKLKKKEAESLEDCLAQGGTPFGSQEEAEAYFFPQRDSDLKELADLEKKFPDLKLDYKATSLKRLEALYFDFYVDKKVEPGIPKDHFETLLTQYKRQVFVANGMAEWIVFENDFAEGRYELGLLYGYGAWTSEHYARDLDKVPDNTARTKLYDGFMLYVPEERTDEVQ